MKRLLSTVAGLFLVVMALHGCPLPSVTCDPASPNCPPDQTCNASTGTCVSVLPLQQQSVEVGAASSSGGVGTSSSGGSSSGGSSGASGGTGPCEGPPPAVPSPCTVKCLSGTCAYVEDVCFVSGGHNQADGVDDGESGIRVGVWLLRKAGRPARPLTFYGSYGVFFDSNGVGVSNASLDHPAAVTLAMDASATCFVLEGFVGAVEPGTLRAELHTYEDTAMMTLYAADVAVLSAQ